MMTTVSSLIRLHIIKRYAGNYSFFSFLFFSVLHHVELLSFDDDIMTRYKAFLNLKLSCGICVSIKFQPCLTSLDFLLLLNTLIFVMNCH